MFYGGFGPRAGTVMSRFAPGRDGALSGRRLRRACVTSGQAGEMRSACAQRGRETERSGALVFSVASGIIILLCPGVVRLGRRARRGGGAAINYVLYDYYYAVVIIWLISQLTILLCCGHCTAYCVLRTPCSYWVGSRTPVACGLPLWRDMEQVWLVPRQRLASANEGAGLRSKTRSTRIFCRNGALPDVHAGQHPHAQGTTA